jgi:hypothetical protein
LSDNAELDPEIAELLGVQKEEKKRERSITEKAGPGKRIPKTDIRRINLSHVLSVKNLYSKLISETGEYGQRVHEFLSKFLKAVEKDEKSMYRERLIPAYWNMLTVLIDNFFEDLSDEKLALYRYGLLNSSFIDETQKQILLNISQSSIPSDDIFFVDEWLILVANGRIRKSAVDETKKTAKNSPTTVKARLERKKGSREAELANYRQKMEQHLLLEKSLHGSVSMLIKHETLSGNSGTLIAPYGEEQKKLIPKIQDLLRRLVRSNKDLESTSRTLHSLNEDIGSIEHSGRDLSTPIDTKAVMEEFNSIRQMTKMTVGRQGNHFPFLIKSYMPKSDLDICTKENLKAAIAEIESIDPGVFIRKYKQEEHRIVPYFIVVPSYGSYGICWEPFERMNKATSRGRIALPLFPKDLKGTLLCALGDLRWQVAKEKALHYWMEEGLTGHYYDYAQQNKLKGDLKEAFIQDYILWIKFESQGMQKLHKDVRSIFWRYIPFPQSIKESLKNRGYYYQELYRKDQNRAMSRGY